MTPGKQSKKGLPNARPALEFKTPKEAPVLGVFIPFGQYDAYLEWAADVATENCKLETANGEGSSDTDDLPDPADIFKKRRKTTGGDLDSSEQESKIRTSGIQKREPQPQRTHSNNDQANETPDIEITGHIAAPPLSLPRSSSRFSGSVGNFHLRRSSQSLASSLNGTDAAHRTLQHQRSTQGRHGALSVASTPTTTAEFEPLDPERLRQAMKIGGSSKIATAHLASLTSNVAENIIIHPVPTRSVHELLAMSNKEGAGTMSSFWSTFEQLDMHHATISVAIHKFEQGVFKTAHEATLLSESNVLLDHFSGNKIIAKRPYFIDKQKFTRLSVTDELADIGNECNVIIWADALLELVYAFMHSVIEKKKEMPPFSTPLLRFARTGYAYVVAPEGSAAATKSSLKALRNQGSVSPSILLGYLLEEKIEGNFVKYIHNGDPSPLLMPTDPEYPVADFLCFTQHVQYVETGNLAFVSDYQDAGDLLTDPQILTHWYVLFSLRTLNGNPNMRPVTSMWYGLAPFDAIEDEDEA
ncbi:hypothetical protein EST38_g8914 [Candolleomyces aberdarensis]|uniref:Alpha-type protein kinase domain-containing protein n=1 Tax=Candolleomyces aberdarensis TaxID=2316362 RepID=A0A4Q2DDL1_9AGAR|nr:hypothetical protein EST38_g8914 [Candolleomyces aberdarensis]